MKEKNPKDKTLDKKPFNLGKKIWKKKIWS